MVLEYKGFFLPACCRLGFLQGLQGKGDTQVELEEKNSYFPHKLCSRLFAPLAAFGGVQADGCHPESTPRDLLSFIITAHTATYKQVLTMSGRRWREVLRNPIFLLGTICGHSGSKLVFSPGIIFVTFSFPFAVFFELWGRSTLQESGALLR